jgi:hypothetical protein
VWLEGLDQLKNPMTSPGIEPATLRKDVDGLLVISLTFVPVLENKVAGKILAHKRDGAI